MTMLLPALRLLCVLSGAAFAAPFGPDTVCMRSCKTDVQCPDTRGVCTYCTGGVCRPPSASCGGGPKPPATTKPQLLVIGDSISIGWTPVLQGVLASYEVQHAPVNCGPASKGFACTGAWLGVNTSRTWDVVLFNFGLHSLDRHRVPGQPPTLPTGEAETLSNYTTEVLFIARLLLTHSRKVIWVDTTPVPDKVTSGPERHNQDVIAFNEAAAKVMGPLGITTADVYGAVMKVCKQTTGPPDLTYTSCALQTPGGVHFPGHYDVLVRPIYAAVTGRPAPAPPPPMTCAQAAAECGCVGSKGEGGGEACLGCYTASKKGNLSGVFDGPACLGNYTNQVPPLPHPQMAFVDCFCFNETANCSSSE